MGTETIPPITQKSFKPDFQRSAISLLYSLYLFSTFVLSFFFSHPLILFCLFCNLLIFALFHNILLKLKMYLRMIVFISIFMFIINILLNSEGEHQLLYIFGENRFFSAINITTENIIASLVSIFRLSIVVFSFAIFNIMINTDDLLRIMLKLRIPHSLVLLITLSLKFIPLLNEDYSNLEEIYFIRSGSKKDGKQSLFSKIRTRIDIILPLLTNSLERSIQIAQALEVRAFGAYKKRTNFYQFTYNHREIFILLGIICYIAFQLILLSTNFVSFFIYPSYTQPIISLSVILASIALILINFAIIIPIRKNGVPIHD